MGLQKIHKPTNLTGSLQDNTRTFKKWLDITLRDKTIPCCCFTVDNNGNLEVLTEITEREVFYLMEAMMNAMRQRKSLIITNKMP